MEDFVEGWVDWVELIVYNGLNVVKMIDSVEVEYVGCKMFDGCVWFFSLLGVIVVDFVNIFINLIVLFVYIESL